MTDDHFDIFEDTDQDIGRWCAPCSTTRHSDCNIICWADREGNHHE